MSRGIYLCARSARIPGFNLVYNDIDGKFNCDIVGDCMEIDLAAYDFILASPPCNYWSRASGNRPKSKYALATRHLLPDLLEKLKKLDKPFILENVRNRPLFFREGIFDLAAGLFIHYHGRHTYFTNMFCSFIGIKQDYDFRFGGNRIKKDVEGGDNVNLVFRQWLINCGFRGVL